MRLGGLGWSWGTCSLDRAVMYDILHCDRNEIISRNLRSSQSEIEIRSGYHFDSMSHCMAASCRISNIQEKHRRCIFTC